MPRPYRPSPLRQSTSALVPLVAQFNRMPPKRRSRAPPPPSSRFPAPSEPPSSLAKQHRITASTEASIRAAFDLFATKTTTRPSSTSSSSSAPELTLPTPALRRALTALAAPARTRADLQDLIAAADPLSIGHISYENFVAVAALQLSTVSPSSDDDDDDGDGGGDDDYNYDDDDDEDDDYVSGRRGKGGREVDEAFRLFLGGGVGGGGGGDKGREEVITLGALRRVARVLKEEVSEDVLRDMILEANGGAGPAGVGKGVRRAEFEGVMRRAGVFR